MTSLKLASYIINGKIFIIFFTNFKYIRMVWPIKSQKTYDLTNQIYPCVIQLFLNKLNNFIDKFTSNLFLNKLISDKIKS